MSVFLSACSFYLLGISFKYGSFILIFLDTVRQSKWLKCDSQFFENLASKQQIAKFYNDSVELSKSVLLKILERSFLGSVVVRHHSVLIQNYLVMALSVKNYASSLINNDNTSRS